MSSILLIEDDELYSVHLQSQLEKVGYTVSVCHTIYCALGVLETNRFDMAIMDLQLPDGNALEYLREIKSKLGGGEVLVLSGSEQASNVGNAIEAGAIDYLTKPAPPSKLRTVVARVLEHSRTHAQPAAKATEGELVLASTGAPLKRGGIVGDGQMMTACLQKVAKAAASEINVLITGETGTGKELFAKAIHENSARSGGNFVVVDCTNIPEGLVESILFGYVRDSFTGARSDREGLFAVADGGSIFLDEIGDLPLENQKSLLRVLQDKSFRPVGAGEERASNFRVIAATNRDLWAMAEEGRFRTDLYYRLNGVGLHLPPLRDRREDLDQLVHHHLGRIAEQLPGVPLLAAPELLEFFMAYPWPGNVRELINVLYQAAADALGEEILYPHHIPAQLRAKIRTLQYREQGVLKGDPEPVSEEKTLRWQVGSDLDVAAQPVRPKVSTASKESLDGRLASMLAQEDMPDMREVRAAIQDSVEEAYIRETMRRSHGSVMEACRITGLSRARIYQLLKKSGVDRHRPDLLSAN